MTRSRLEYRTARFTDADKVVELCAKFHAESWQSFADFNVEKMHGWIVSQIDNDDAEIFTAWDGTELIGCLIGMVVTFPYSNTLVAGDYIWYVVPESRGGMTGIRLMRMFESWARGVGAVRISTGATSGINTERASMLMERLGFSPVGVIMQKES
jgi:GNAT superfamily N-acetyltransferase